MIEIFTEGNFLYLEQGLTELNIKRSDVVGKNLDEFEKAVKKSYHSLSLKLHSDKSVGKPDKERKESEEKFKKLATTYKLLIGAEDFIKEGKNLSSIEYELFKLFPKDTLSKRGFYYKGKLFKLLNIEEKDVVGKSYEDLKKFINDHYEKLHSDESDLIEEMIKLKRDTDELIEFIKCNDAKITEEEYEEKKELFEKCNFSKYYVCLENYDTIISKVHLDIRSLSGEVNEEKIKNLNSIEKYIQSCRKKLRNKQFEEKNEIFNDLKIKESDILELSRNQLIFKIGKSFDLECELLHSHYKKNDSKKANITKEEILRMQAYDELLKYIEPMSKKNDVIHKDKEKNLNTFLEKIYSTYRLSALKLIKFFYPYSVPFLVLAYFSFTSWSLLIATVVLYSMEETFKYFTQKDKNDLKTIMKNFEEAEKKLSNAKKAFCEAGTNSGVDKRETLEENLKKARKDFDNAFQGLKKSIIKHIQLLKYSSFYWFGITLSFVSLSIVLYGASFVNIIAISLIVSSILYSILLSPLFIFQRLLFCVYTTLNESFPIEELSKPLELEYPEIFKEFMNYLDSIKQEDLSWYQRWLVNCINHTVTKIFEEIIPDQSEKIPEETMENSLPTGKKTDIELKQLSIVNLQKLLLQIRA